jgi:hypothetical protein
MALVIAAMSCSFYVACGDDDVIFEPSVGGTGGTGGRAGGGGTGGITAGTGGTTAGTGGTTAGTGGTTAGTGGATVEVDAGVDGGTDDGGTTSDD